MASNSISPPWTDHLKARVEEPDGFRYDPEKVEGREDEGLVPFRWRGGTPSAPKAATSWRRHQNLSRGTSPMSDRARESQDGTRVSNSCGRSARVLLFPRRPRGRSRDARKVRKEPPEIVAHAKQKQAETGINCCGHGQRLRPRLLHERRIDQPRLRRRGFAPCCRSRTPSTPRSNWAARTTSSGRPRGYMSLLNTDMKRENMATMLGAWPATTPARRVQGQLLIEPKNRWSR